MQSSNSAADPVAQMRRDLEAQLPPYRTIVVGTDGSDTAQEAVRHAVAISRALGATLHLVSVAPPRNRRALEDEARDAPDDIRHTINAREDVSALLDAVAGQVGQFGVDVVAHAEIGSDPASVILQVAERTQADLIVVGSRGMTGLGRVLGSVPNAISHHATCSVAIIRTT